MTLIFADSGDSFFVTLIYNCFNFYIIVIMKKKLIIKYVGLKLGKFEPIVAEAKSIFSETEYEDFVASINVNKEMDSSLKHEIEAVLRKRFQLGAHKCIFYMPTVGQWIADLIGKLTKDDILEALCQASGMTLNDFKGKTFGSNVLNVPFLEDLIELFEGATGKKLLRYGHLYHLGDSYTYDELAEFFATA